MENKTKKRILAIVAAVLAVVIIVVAILLILSQCQGGGKPPKKVVVVTNNDKENDDNEQGDDSEQDDDPYASDDITLDLGYTGNDIFEAYEIMDNASNSVLFTVDNDGEPLNKFFRGITGTVYHSSEYINHDPHGRKYTEEMLDLELSRLRDSGFKILRTIFWSDWMWTGDPNNPWDTESQTMLDFYAWCKKVEEYGLKVAPIMMWNYPGLFYGGNNYLVEVDYLIPKKLDENGNPILAYDFGQYHDLVDHELQNERCADFVATTAKALYDHGVTNFFGFFFSTEPKEDGGLATGAFAKWQVDTFVACEQALRDAGFRNKGSDNYVTLIGPNQNSLSGRGGLARYFMENAPHVFDIYTSHTTLDTQSVTDDPYDDNYRIFSGYVESMDLFGLRHKQEYWLDEFGSNGDAYNEELDLDDPWFAVNRATQHIAAFNAGVSAISIWQFLDQTWPDYYGSGGEYEYGTQRSGSAPSLYKSEVPWSIYYTESIFAKFTGVEGGTTYKTAPLEDGGGLYAVTVKLADGGWTVLIVNMSTDEKTFTMNFDEAINATLYRYLYEAGNSNPTSAASVTVADKGFKNVKKTFSDTLAGGSVVAYSTMECFTNQ
ncbi:MAG: hypothetical protein IJ426_06875 [Clostridia bacterium]|nr:hypothetical protein [Clostridia bacterium]